MKSMATLSVLTIYNSTIYLYKYLTILIENWILSNEIISSCIINHLKQLKACSPNPVYVIINLAAINSYSIKQNKQTNPTLKVTTLVIFHISIRRPMETLTLTMKFVSLSRTYRTTMRDWKTLKKTDRTDRPSKDLRFFQNCMSIEKKSKISHIRICINYLWSLIQQTESIEPNKQFDVNSFRNLPFLKARNSNTLWTIEIITVIARR